MSSEMNDYYKNERLLPAIYLLVLVNWTTIELVNGNSFTQEEWLFFATRKIMKLIFSTVQESFKRKISNSKNAKIMNFSLKQAHNATAEFINVMENTQNKILTTNKTLPTYLPTCILANSLISSAAAIFKLSPQSNKVWSHQLVTRWCWAVFMQRFQKYYLQKCWNGKLQ